MTISTELDGKTLRARRDGREVGRLAIILEPPLVAYLAAPRVAEGEPALETARALLDAGAAAAREAGCPRVEVILEDRLTLFVDLVQAMLRWGHRPVRTKLLFRRPVEGLPEIDSPLSFVRLSGADDPRLRSVLEAVFADGVTAEREGQTASEMIEELENLCRHVDPEAPGHWEVAEIGGEPVGAVLPGFVEPGVGTNLFVCMVPAHRGEGHGAPTHLRGLRISADRGAKGLIGSCEEDNEPMARVFRRLGYEQGAVQRYFAWED
jgi:RimJ/RimL family protein N-acetyltransferase